MTRKKRKTAKAEPPKIAKMDSSDMIAKMDVVKRNNQHDSNDVWIVPLIAKMDVVRAKIFIISDESQNVPGRS